MLYLADVIRDKLDPQGRIQLVLDICRKRGTRKVFYESIGFQSTDCSNLKELARKEGYSLSVTEVPASMISKLDRIRSLQPLYERGDIRWPKRYDYYSQYERKSIEMTEVLRKEFLLFPSLRFFDLTDCHSFITRIHLAKGATVADTPQEDMLDKIIRTQVLDKQTQRKPRYSSSKPGRGIPFTESLW